MALQGDDSVQTTNKPHLATRLVLRQGGLVCAMFAPW